MFAEYLLDAPWRHRYAGRIMDEQIRQALFHIDRMRQDQGGDWCMAEIHCRMFRHTVHWLMLCQGWAYIVCFN